MAARSKRTYEITSLQRGLRLLHLFSESPRGLTAKQVAGLSQLPVSTVHRFLANLVTASFLSCDGDGRYNLGIACFAIGQAAVGQLDIRRLSLPYLTELNQQTRETIHLTVRHGLTAVYVEKLDSPEPLRIHSRIGSGVPLYCTAVGKVMLAYLAGEELDLILSELNLKRLTPNTVGNLQELKAELYRVQQWIRLRPRRARNAHSLLSGSHLGSHGKRSIEPQYYSSCGADADYAPATTRTVDSECRAANLAPAWLPPNRKRNASSE